MGLFPPVMQNLSMNRSGEEEESTGVTPGLTPRASEWSFQVQWTPPWF